MVKKFDVLIALLDKGAEGRLSDLSSDLDELRRWIDNQEETSDRQSSSDEAVAAITGESKVPKIVDLNGDLRRMANSFEEAMAGYRSVAVMAGALETAFPQIMFDTDVRKLVETRGVEIEARGKYRVYGVPEGLSHDLYAGILKISEYRVGVEQLNPALLLSLVARYDSFVKDLLKRLLIENPSRYEGSDKKISIAEMLSLSSFEEMLDKIIEDELSDLLRGSHDEHSSYIKKTFNVDVSDSFPGWLSYLEIFERRNVLAHNNRIVDKHYIRNIKRQTKRDPEFALGDELNVDSDYLVEAVELCTEAGVRLLFSVWRNHSKGNDEPVYHFVNEFCFNLIKNKRFGVAIRILTYILDQSSPKNPEKHRRMMAVNLANAYKIKGNKSASEAALNRFQWDSSSDEFKICVAAVRDDVDSVVPLMERVKSEDEIGKSGFRTWPVFSKIRRDPAFGAEFERLFGEPVVSAESRGEPNPLDTGRGDLESSAEPIVEHGKSESAGKKPRRRSPRTTH